METEQAVLSALEAGVGWQVEGKRLARRDGQDEVVARFEAVHLF